MEKIEKLLEEIILNEKLIDGKLSDQRKKDKDSFRNVDIEPVLIQGEIKYQFTFNYQSKVLHENLSHKEAASRMEGLLGETFKQAMFFTKDADYHILISKKGKVRILEKEATKSEIDLSHNRKKSI